MIAEIFGMPLARFFAANGTSAIVWATLHVGSAVIAGACLAALLQASGSSRARRRSHEFTHPSAGAMAD